MTAAVAADRNKKWTGLRAVNPRRDMAALADLIELAFYENLDPGGRSMVHGMRRLGRLGWFGWILGRFLLPPAANPMGYVWEQDGLVVGNVSLLPVERYPKRWVMANVAVKPAYRRQGIGSRLVQASIEFVREAKGELIILQADRKSEGVEAMYVKEGFQPYSTRTRWYCRSVRNKGGGPGSEFVRPREYEEWVDQWELARKNQPEGIIWPYPPEMSLFRPSTRSRWLSTDQRRHWVWDENGEKTGFLSAKWNLEQRHWYLLLTVDPRAHGRVEDGLLNACLAGLGSGACLLEYPSDTATSVIHKYGFVPQRTLTWMGLRVGSR